MNYGSLVLSDIANGPGVRVSLFVSGCRNHCEGCFNPETWNFDYGNKFDDITKNKIYGAMDDYHSGLTILGGDPMEPENAEELLPFVREFKDKFPDKNVWLYSGYTYEWLDTLEDARKSLLDIIDVLVDGKFVLSQKDITLKFRGSKNQRLIDLNKTRESGEIVLVR